MQHLVAGQHLAYAAIGLAAFADGGDELAVLQFYAVHRHRDLVHVYTFFIAVEQIVLARDVGGAVTEVAEEGPQRADVVEA